MVFPIHSEKAMAPDSNTVFHLFLFVCFCYPACWTLEKAMAPHSSTLAWKIPWTEEPGRLQSLGSLRVGHDWATSLSLFTFMHWRRKWQPTLVFLPGESQGQGSLVGFHLWGRTESDTTEATWQHSESWSSVGTFPLHSHPDCPACSPSFAPL